MGVQGEESWLGGSSQGRVAVGLASKGVITRVPHQLLSAKLQGEIKKVGRIETRLLKLLENCQNIAISVAMLPWFFLFVYFVIPLPCFHPCDRDGKLKEADQILAINGQALDQTITHQQAISILQKAKDNVQLVVARGTFPQLISPVVSRSPSAASTVSAHSNPVSISQTSVYSVLCRHVLTAYRLLSNFL